MIIYLVYDTMKILRLNGKTGEAQILIQSDEDLPSLTKVIQEGDTLIGKTERKIKRGGEENRQKVIRKTITLEIKVTKTILDTNSLRVQGKVITPTEDIPINSAHTIEITKGSDFKIKKNEWFKYQIDQLRDAEKTSHLAKVFLCALDDEQASFGKLSASGIQYLGKISLRLTKKRLEEKKKDEIKKVAQEVIARAAGLQIIIASPLFWKELVFKEIKSINPKVAKRVIQANVSAGTKKGLQELLSTGTVDKLMQGAAIAKHEILVDRLLEEISKNKLAAYGKKEVEKAAYSKAISDLLISEKLMSADLQELIKFVEKGKGHVHIIDSKSDAGKKLLGLSGIAAILKFKI